MDEISKFCRQQVEQGISLKSSLIEYELRRLGIGHTRLNNRQLACEIEGRPAAFHLMNGPLSSVCIRSICDNKWLARQFLAARGLSVASSGRFTRTSATAAMEFAKSKIGYPVVIKPNSASRGRGVTTNILDDASFQAAWNTANSSSRSQTNLVERQVDGEDYRFFVVGGKVVSATWRRRANVVGDGKRSILDLIKEKNNARSKNLYLKSYPIPTEISLLEALGCTSHTLSHIPSRGEYIELRNVSNASAGGDTIDVTDEIHPSFKEIAVTAVQACPGMLYGGVDIIAKNIYEAANPSTYAVAEIEFSPAPLAHFPFSGEARNMAGAIINAYIKNKS